MSPSCYSAIIAGASGLIGNELLQCLLHDKQCQRIESINRQHIPYHSKKLIQYQDPHLSLPTEEHASSIEFGYICLGSTRKQAGSAEQLKAIDVDLVLHVAKQMKQRDVRCLTVVSSMGAHPRSLSHYLRCKGMMEKQLEQLHFEQLIIVRPSALLGDRSQSRTNEKIVQSIWMHIKPILLGKLQSITPIEAEMVAKHMHQASLSFTPSTSPIVTTITNKQLHQNTKTEDLVQ